MFSKLFNKDFFADKRILVLAAVQLAVAIFFVARVAVTIEPVDYKISVRYTQFGIDTFVLGDWFELAYLGAFPAVITVAVLLVAMRFYPLNRQLSYALIFLHFIALFFLGFVINALLSIPI